MNIKILVATHKQYQMPTDDIYLPIHVGKEGKDLELGYICDNTGNNISIKNPNYCELTGIYWAWKNFDADYIGLVHYRRHLSRKNFLYRLTHNKKKCILTRAEIEKLLGNIDVVLPKKRKYYIETIKSHYAHTHDASHLEITRKIIEKQCPEYLESFNRVMKRTSAHMFNMFIMKKEYMAAYCEWLFSILEALEKQVDLKGMTAFQARLFGRISERLLDVWLEKEGVKYKEIAYIHMDKINWPKKIKSFLLAKFTNKKYKESF